MLLDQALSPALGFLRDGTAGEKAAAAALLGNIADGRPGAAGFLVAEGALPHAAELLVKGAAARKRRACDIGRWRGVSPNMGGPAIQRQLTRSSTVA